MEPEGAALASDSLAAAEGLEFNAAFDGHKKVISLELHTDVLVDTASALDVANALRVIATQTFKVPEGEFGLFGRGVWVGVGGIVKGKVLTEARVDDAIAIAIGISGGTVGVLLGARR